MESSYTPLHRMDQRNDSKELRTLPRHVGLISKIKKGWSKLTHNWWAWEISAAVVSVGASAALITVLAKANGRQQQFWNIGSTQLTLNTVVAILSTVIRAALLVTVAGALNQSPWNWFANGQHGHQQRLRRPLNDLDIFGEAAMSSWASLKLLYRTKFRYLASLGAIVTILSLAFDAFAQQVLAADICMVPDPGSSTNVSAESILPRTTSYTTVVEAQFPGAIWRIDYQSAPLVAQAAIVSGVVGTNGARLTASCLTGNCTWPTTPTIGVCSACSDVKGQLNVSKSGGGNLTILTYSLPWNDQFKDADSEIVSLTFNSTEIFVLASAGSYNPPLGRQTIATFYALGIPPSSFSDVLNADLHSQYSMDHLMVAYNCNFHFCLQAYNATSTSGIMKQELVGTWDQMNETGQNPVSFSDTYPQPFWAFIDVPGRMNVVNASAYRVDFESRLALTGAFEGILGGTVNVDGLTKSPYFIATQGSSISSSTSVQGMWMAANSTATMTSQFRTIADTFTAYMRTELTASPDRRYAPTTFSAAIFVRVRWPWLVYPLGLLLMGHFFLAATIFQTSRRAVRPWKGQRLPLLLADVDDIVREFAAGSLHRRDGLEERVGRIQVQMEFDGQDRVAFKQVR